MPEFFWENESWAFSNSDNSGKSTDENPGKKLPEATNSNCPTMRIAEPGPSSIAGKKRSKSGNKTSGAEGDEQGNKGGGESDHEMHIWTERERRKKMRSMFANLHALLPQLPPKADKSTIVDEAVNYIKSLQQTLQKLQKQKLERLHGTVGTISYESSLTIPTRRVSMDSSREAFLADQGSATQSSVNPVSQLHSPSPAFSRYPAIYRTWVSPNVILSVSGDHAHINVCSVKKLGMFTAICFFLEKHNLEVVSVQVSSDHCRSMYMIHARASGALHDHTSHEIFSFEEIFQQAAAEIMTYITSP